MKQCYCLSRDMDKLAYCYNRIRHKSEIPRYLSNNIDKSQNLMCRKK